jgi:hypothetical protein
MTKSHDKVAIPRAAILTGKRRSWFVQTRDAALDRALRRQSFEINLLEMFGDCSMTTPSIKTLLAASAMTALANSAFAQTPAPAPWVLSPDMGYAYETKGKMFSYKMGTSNAKFLLKGAKRVPNNTLFFIGENGQLFMRTGPYLEGDGRFSFGPE